MTIKLQPPTFGMYNFLSGVMSGLATLAYTRSGYDPGIWHRKIFGDSLLFAGYRQERLTGWTFRRY
ncbi:MAG: hypothetical protein NTAFB01_41120 [Nitrospira sp.]